MARTRKQPIQRGQTEKISVSLDRNELGALRRRARRLYGGNLSAVIAEGVRRVREEEGREALVAWLGSSAELSDADRAATAAEWSRGARRRPRRTRVA
jgi:hypothetical protein